MNNLINYLILIPVILITVTIHEYTKALTSTLLGDTIPKSEGRLTLNPFKHFEAIGFILLLVWRFGWGLPLRTSALYYKDRKRDTMITYVSPIIANLVFAFIFAVIFKFVGNLNQYLGIFFSQLVIYNISIAIFNIIPVYPLCGNKILSSFLTPNQIIKMNQYEKIILMLLAFLIFMGFLGSLLNPIIYMIYNLFMLI